MALFTDLSLDRDQIGHDPADIYYESLTTHKESLLSVGTRQVGAGSGERARRSASLGLGVSGAAGCAVAAGIVLCAKPIAALYASGATRDLVRACARPLAALVLASALNTTAQGSLSGAGIPGTIARANLLSWYAVGVPLALSLVYALDLDRGACAAILLSCAAAHLSAFGFQTHAVLFSREHALAESANRRSARLNRQTTRERERETALICPFLERERERERERAAGGTTGRTRSWPRASGSPIRRSASRSSTPAPADGPTPGAVLATTTPCRGRSRWSECGETIRLHTL